MAAPVKDLFIALQSSADNNKQTSSDYSQKFRQLLDFAAPEKYPVDCLISRDGNHMQGLHRWCSSTGFKLFVFAGVVSIQPWN